MAGWGAVAASTSVKGRCFLPWSLDVSRLESVVSALCPRRPDEVLPNAAFAHATSVALAWLA
jgi:hypothetical protein